jgi:hypothetical protein
MKRLLILSSGDCMRFVIFAALFSTAVFAQTFQGTLRGRVLDPNGATASAASITLTDEGTSVSRKTITNDQGEYTFASLTPSTYTVTVEASGFKRIEQRGVMVATQAVVTLDFALQLGTVTEEVNVTADAPLLQTGDASTGQLINTEQITDLPLLGRNPFLTGKLAHSVVFAGNPQFTRMQDQNGNSQVSIGGGPMRTNNYLVDGISITDSNNRAVILPSPGSGPGTEDPGKHIRRGGRPHRRRDFQHSASLRHERFARERGRPYSRDGLAGQQLLCESGRAIHRQSALPRLGLFAGRSHRYPESLRWTQ